MAARATVTPKKSVQKPESANIPVQERIRQRAYDLYLQRGGADGSADDDWLQAETEMAAEFDQKSK
jgi:hypothetical protein